MSRGLSYRDAGVDLEAAERAKEGPADLVASTRDSFTLSELGSFGGPGRLTGGGIPGNLPRALPDGLGARIERGAGVTYA